MNQHLQYRELPTVEIVAGARSDEVAHSKLASETKYQLQLKCMNRELKKIAELSFTVHDF